MGSSYLDSLFLFLPLIAATIEKVHRAIPPTKIPIPIIEPSETESAIFHKDINNNDINSEPI